METAVETAVAVESVSVLGSASVTTSGQRSSAGSRTPDPRRRTSGPRRRTDFLLPAGRGGPPCRRLTEAGARRWIITTARAASPHAARRARRAHSDLAGHRGPSRALTPPFRRTVPVGFRVPPVLPASAARTVRSGRRSSRPRFASAFESATVAVPFWSAPATWRRASWPTGTTRRPLPAQTSSTPRRTTLATRPRGIPARPFLGLSADARGVIVDAIVDHPAR